MTKIEETTPWITPDKAREIVKVAENNIIRKVCKWLKKNANNYIEIKDGALQYKKTLCTNLKKELIDMTKAEERAAEVFPIRDYAHNMEIKDIETKRKIFIKGYKQAEKDCT